VRRVALQAPVELARVRQRRDLEALLGEIARQQVAQAHVVVDNQDLRCQLRVHDGHLTRERARVRRNL
jgi:hypothetical protein